MLQRISQWCRSLPQPEDWPTALFRWRGDNAALRKRVFNGAMWREEEVSLQSHCHDGFAYSLGRINQGVYTKWVQGLKATLLQHWEAIQKGRSLEESCKSEDITGAFCTCAVVDLAAYLMKGQGFQSGSDCWSNILKSYDRVTTVWSQRIDGTAQQHRMKDVSVFFKMNCRFHYCFLQIMPFLCVSC